MPLTYSERKVPKPKTIPPAKEIKQTERLLVMIALEAIGATLTTDSVHIVWRSMVAIISGLTKWRMNSGRAMVSAAPSRPKATETASAAATKPIWRWKMAGYSSRRKRKRVRRLALRPE